MNKSEIKGKYNIDRIVTAKELVSLSRTYKDNLDTIIVMMKRKENQPKVPKYFTDFVEKQEKFNQLNASKIDLLIEEFRSFKKEVLSRLDNHDKLFKQHGWV